MVSLSILLSAIQIEGLRMESKFGEVMSLIVAPLALHVSESFCSELLGVQAALLLARAGQKTLLHDLRTMNDGIG